MRERRQGAAEDDFGGHTGGFWQNRRQCTGRGNRGDYSNIDGEGAPTLEKSLANRPARYSLPAARTILTTSSIAWTMAWGSSSGIQ